MTPPVTNRLRAAALIALGLALAAMGFSVANADDAPGAAAMGLLLMLIGVVLGVRAARGRLPTWAARTALAIGAVLAAFAAVLTHSVLSAAPLFPPREIPAAVETGSTPSQAAAVERARAAVRAAMRQQNLPGVSVAVAAGGDLVWAEGFGWRDVDAEAPVRPVTRFNIGTAAAAVAPAAERLGLRESGADPAAVWSPERIGEPEEDFPLFTLIRDVVVRPLGFARAEPLPGDRATFYVPRADGRPASGRRLMRMRDLACCANGLAFYSTPSDLVRVAMATKPGRLHGELAGGPVMSLVTSADGATVVAVTANIAHANTSGLAQRIAAAFATP